jgi:hypothetical protein
MKHVVLFLFPILICSCVGGTLLRTEGIDDASSITGTFSVIFHGGKHIRDYETLAILDLEGDGYEIVPYSPEFSYVVERGLSAGDAFEAAERFVRRHKVYRHTKVMMRRVLDEGGADIGYELRPYYKAFILGGPDVLDVRYLLGEDRKVRVVIDLKIDVGETGLMDGD